MIQEVIVYIIVFAAVVFVFSKLYKNLFRKKQEVKKQKNNIKNKCQNCKAECMLRNAPYQVGENDTEQCSEINNMN